MRGSGSGLRSSDWRVPIRTALGAVLNPPWAARACCCWWWFLMHPLPLSPHMKGSPPRTRKAPPGPDEDWQPTADQSSGYYCPCHRAQQWSPMRAGSPPRTNPLASVLPGAWPPPPAARQNILGAVVIRQHACPPARIQARNGRSRAVLRVTAGVCAQNQACTCSKYGTDSIASFCLRYREWEGSGKGVGREWEGEEEAGRRARTRGGHGYGYEV